jgi:hypothetical protein
MDKPEIQRRLERLVADVLRKDLREREKRDSQGGEFVNPEGIAPEAVKSQ